MTDRGWDAVVVGGGIVGCSIAYFLARKALRVLVLEKDTIAAGTSRANGGNILLSEKLPGPSLDMAKDSVALHGALSETLDDDTGFTVTGGLLVAESERDWAALRAHAAALGAAGVRVEYLTGADIRACEPALADDILGAVRFPDEMKIDPVLFTGAMLRQAQREGAEVRERTAAVGFRLNQGRLSAVRTEGGDIPTACAAVAAGAWSVALLREVGVELPVKPRKGQLLVTQYWPEAPRHTMLAAGYLTSKYGGGEHDRPAEAAGLTLDMSYSRTKDGNCLIGSSREFAGFSNDISHTVARRLAARACRFMPKLAGVKVARIYAGLRPFVPDHMPIIGPIESVPGLMVAAGHEGDGITLAPITGQLVADAVTEGAGKKIAPYLPSRFGNGLSSITQQGER